MTAKQTCCEKCKPTGQDINGFPNWQCTNPMCECHWEKASTPTDRDKFIDEQRVKFIENNWQSLSYAIDPLIPEQEEATKTHLRILWDDAVLPALCEAWEMAEKNGNKTDGEQGAMALLYGMRVKKNPLVPEDEIWIGTGKDGLKIKIQPSS